MFRAAIAAGGLPPRFPYQSLYRTTKFGVVGMSECLRYELADEGIRVSAACPGDVVSRIFATPILGEAVEAKPSQDAIPAADAAAIILADVAAQRRKAFAAGDVEAALRATAPRE